MIMKFGVIKLVNASWSIIGKTQDNVELTIVENGNERVYKNLTVGSSISKIRKVLNLPDDYVV